jgi:hypothetical protein
MNIALPVVLGAAMAVSANPAVASHDPSGAPLDQDFAEGSGSFAGEPASSFRLDAHSGPQGEDPTGSAFFVQFGFFVEGPVTCLIVDDNRAVLGMRVERSNISVSGLVFTVVDARGIGSDKIHIEQAGADPTCSPTEADIPINGNIVVHDAATLPTIKDQCKNGGWRTYGVFRNQGDCVSFVATGGKNPPGAKAG